ncbi:MAG: zinc ribbon domain-containing protein [Actinobacteria bacterium]|nr:zinc ribbon domain-containing protein [Actinomycetota bacterium]MBU4416961.1 zinc ribbon domain-containing protein [Actinomycetota bacterium]MBU4588303.1 zinc ribbon domain-containing protein [Actinomycetota bacterium]
MSYCTACGAKIAESAKFCASCGTAVGAKDEEPIPEGYVLVPPEKLRVKPGLLSMISELDVLLLTTQNVPLHEDSREYAATKVPFRADRPHGPEDLVPLDCVWARTTHPGRMPSIDAFTLRGKFSQMGQLAARTRIEIVSVVGAPTVTAGNMATWTNTFGSYSITLLFDDYNVCAGVGSELSF